MAVKTKKKTWQVNKVVFWLSVSLAFFVGAAFQGCIDRFSGISFDRQEQEVPSTSLARWVKAERPKTLTADYPAVGAVLADTAKRLRNGTLKGLNDATADTIARIQVIGQSPDKWRMFVVRMATQITGGSAEQIAKQYDDAAAMFGAAPADVLAVVPPNTPVVINEGKNEKATDEDNGKASFNPDGSAGDKSRQASSGDQRGGGKGKQSDSAKAPVKTNQPPVRSGSACPSGTCGYGWGGAW